MNDTTQHERPALSVLIVDEDPSVLILLTGILEGDGIRTLRARGFAEAQEIAARQYVPIDAVLSNLPHGSRSIDTLRQIRPGLRFLFISTRMEGGIVRMDLSPEHNVSREHGLGYSIRALLTRERSVGAGQSIQ